MSPEELRQQIAEALWAMPAYDAVNFPQSDADADAILALPAIRRALARDAAIDAARFENGDGVGTWVSVGENSAMYADDLIRQLRAVGDTE